MTGILTGKPLPFLNLDFLSTSNSLALIAFLSSIIVILAVVPPISKEITLFKSNSSAMTVAKIAPPAGPDSTNLTGNSHALSTLVKVPPDVISNKDALKPSSIKLFLRFSI